MRPFTSIISLDEARRRLDATVRPITRIERVPLADAAGRVAAADVAASIAVPPFARSAMDGYAVVAAETQVTTRAAPVRLRIVDRIHTGQMPRNPVGPGVCAEIATGAPLPDGADAVVMVEETRRAGGDHVEILTAASPEQNIGRRGADIQPGDLVVRRGDALNPSRVGALAAIGRVDLDVYARPRVAVLSTGNEVTDPGVPLAPGQIFDVNRFTLAAVIAGNGGIPEVRRPVQDTMEALAAALDACAGADLIVFSGGSSVGNRDLIVDVLAGRGDIIFHGMAVKPGKPTAFALVGETPFFGMPGNPLRACRTRTSCWCRSCARPRDCRPTRRKPHARRSASASCRRPADTSSIRVRLRDGAAFPAFKGSGEITSLSQADGYIEIPADQSTVEEGTIVEVTLF